MRIASRVRGGAVAAHFRQRLFGNPLRRPGYRPARPELSAGWIALILAMLTAFTCQSVLVETHFHLSLRSAQGAAADDGASATQLTQSKSSSDSPANCPLCREAAQAGHYLSPGPLVLAQPATLIFAPLVLLLVRWSRRRRSHAWQSRGPPLLQAR